MQKRHTIIYWVATVWLSLAMVSSGIIQLIQREEDIADFLRLGYPAYFLSLIGVWKVLGTVAILVPGRPLVKEWAYAGFFFTMSGAVVSHLAMGDAITDWLPALLLSLLTLISWYFRPASRTLVPRLNS